MNICVAANSKYVRYLYVMITSLMENNDREDISLYVLENDFTTDDKKLLEKLVADAGKKIFFIYVDRERFEGLPMAARLRSETYFRLLMPYSLPQDVSRVMYLDVDLVVRYPLSELYNIELGDKFLAACLDMMAGEISEYKRDLFRRKDDRRYFNDGVMVWDLDKFRSCYKFEDFMNAVGELNNELYWADQDLLNYMLVDKVLYLDPYKYNYVAADFDKSVPLEQNQAKIIHFLGCCPWQIGPKTENYKLWWDYAKKTPFYVELLEEQLARIEYSDAQGGKLYRQIYEMKNIWEAAVGLLGTDKVAETMRAFDDYFVIYGAGEMAEVLSRLVEPKNTDGKLSAVVDKTKHNLWHGLEIKHDFSFMEPGKKYCVIVTPSYEVRELVDEIQAGLPDNAKVVSLLDFLREIH